MDDYTSNRYKIIGKIGEGVHGVVVKAYDILSQKEVAIKKISIKTKHGNISLNAIREIKVLQNCKCEYILSLNEMFPDMTGLSLVFDFMPNTLYSRIKDDKNPMSRQEVKKYLNMLLIGIEYLHRIGILHRDIKPANLLISAKGILKIGDFGLARLFFPNDKDKLYSPQVTTRWYRAPEILWGSQKYGPPIDMWAVGCVFAEMLRGVPLFAGTTDIEHLALVIRILGTPKSNDWPELETLPDYHKIRFPYSMKQKWQKLFPSCTNIEDIDLVAKLIVYNPKNRLTASQALQHEYFLPSTG